MIEFMHLYDSDGRWVAWYRQGLPHVWSVEGAWVGWFPWAEGELVGDVLDPADEYLGTVVDDRLWRRLYRTPVAVPRQVGEPRRPPGPPNVGMTTPRPPPPGFGDVAPDRLRGGG